MSTADPKGHAMTEDLYKEVQPYYSRFYSDTHIHYGYWDNETKSSQEAIRNTSRTVCDLLDLQAGDLVLDAGCGLGGTSILLAQEYGARVEGVDSSRSNLMQAVKNATAANVGHMVAFSWQDHAHTSFDSGRFDHLIAIESVSACDHAEGFLKEAHRLLRSGGTLVIVAPHLGRSTGGAPLFKKRHGSHLVFEVNRSREEFCGIIEQAGFRDVRAIDLMGRIRLASRTWFVVPLLCVLALSKLRITKRAIGDNLHTLLESERAMAKGQIAMAIFVGKK